MSIETIAWAKEQRCGCHYAKAVLLELANWARPNGVCEFRRVRDIAAVIEVSERTVQRALKLLEADPKDEGLGLIQRVIQHREDGGQKANRFELVGYIYRGDCQSLPNDMQSPGVRPLVTGRSDALVTPKLNQESKQIDSPQGPRNPKYLRQRISSEWLAPSVQELPTSSQSLAGQWPPSAYNQEAEAFQQYWLGTGQRRADWNALWAARVQSQHERVMKVAKADNPHSAREPEPNDLSRTIKHIPTARAIVDEDDRSALLRQTLREKVGEQKWGELFAPAAYIFDLPGLKVFVGTTLAQEELESRYVRLVHAAAQSIDPEVTWVRFDTEQCHARKAL